MNFLLPHNRKPILESFTVPEHLKVLALLYMQCRYKLFEEGEMLSQLMLGLDYSIWVHYFVITQYIKVHPVTTESILTLHYMRKGNIKCFLKGSGEKILKEGKVILFTFPGQVINDAELIPGVYSFVQINFHPAQLVIIAKQYPIFEPMLSRAEKKVKRGKQLPAVDITGEVINLLYAILNCRLQGIQRTLLLEARIKDLLRVYIRDQVMQDQELKGAGTREDQYLIKVQNHIEKNLGEDLSVERLAKLVFVSKAWLQRICFRTHGKYIHELVIWYRMEEAKRLLLGTNEPVSLIVQQVSNMNFPSFSTAFKRYTGNTPLQFRRIGS
jgi:AraC-like DNA-binding protein